MRQTKYYNNVIIVFASGRKK